MENELLENKEFSLTRRITIILASLFLPVFCIFFFNYNVIFPFTLLVGHVDINLVFDLESVFFMSICVLLIARLAGLSISDLGLKKVKQNTFWRSLLIASIVPLLYLPLWLITHKSNLLVVKNLADLFGVIIAAVFEELLFRGTVLKAIGKCSSLKTGIALQAVVFGVAHFQSHHGYLPSILLLMLVGYTFGLARTKSDSLLPGMIGHFLQDLVTSQI